MSKYRVYEIAKEYNTTSKVIIDILARHNIETKNHMSSVDDAAKNIIARTFAAKTSSNVKKPVNEPQQNARRENNQVQSRPNFDKNNAAPQGARNQHQSNQEKFTRQNTNTNTNMNTNRQEHRQYPNQQRSGQYSNQHNNYNHSKQPARQGTPSDNQQQTHNPSRGQNQQQPQGQNRPYQQGNYAKKPNQFNKPKPNDAQRNSNFNRPKPNPTQSSNQQRPQQNSNVNTQQRTNKPKHNNPKHQFHDKNDQGTRKLADLQRKSHHPNKKHYKNKHANEQAQAKLETARPNNIQIGEKISVKDLAAAMGRDVSDIIKKLMLLGVMATINQEIDFDTAVLIASDFGVTVEAILPEADPTEIPDVEDDPESLQPRPPVVTVMGHVDHGKTSLLDAIRKSNVTAREAGGITQHIGAYQVNCQGKKIVFLDTPGHEAFTAMRARGAMVTDIAILVVAADDGVMPQTIEAINHAKSAKVPIIVAINKIDRPQANPEHVKQQLTEYGLIDEAWGGDTIMVPVSAHQKTGINDLLEMILLVAEMQELKANANRSAVGTVIEAQLDKGRGPVATILIQKGTIRIGDTIIAGTAYGKVRAMVNDRGEKVKKAGPSTPVEVLGLNDVPAAGDVMMVTDEKNARNVAEKRIAKRRGEELEYSQKVSLDDLFNQIKEGNLKQLNIVIKADVQGSIEALRQSLLKLKNEEVKVDVIHTGVGAINESDVMLASASNALILGFNVRPDSNARKSAEAEAVDVRTYRVIYDAINDVEAALKGMLAPKFKEVILGRIEVRKVFQLPKVLVAGCYVLEGKVTNNSQIRLIRDGIVTYEGQIDSLKRFKDDVKEVAEGYECGISLEKIRDVKEADIIEAFIMEEVKDRG